MPDCSYTASDSLSIYQEYISSLTSLHSNCYTGYHSHTNSDFVLLPRGRRSGKKVIQSEIVQENHIQTIVTRRDLDREFAYPRSRGVNYHNLLPVVLDKTRKWPATNSTFAIWNARSLSRKSTVLCDTILSKKIDIIVITETWLKGDSRDSTIIADINNSLPDHQIIHQPRSTRGGGVCVITRKGYNINNCVSRTFKSFEHLDLQVSSGTTHLRLVALYRPPPSRKNKLSTSLFFEEFSSFLESLIIVPSHLIIAGDFNFHVDNIPEDRDASTFMDLLQSFGLEQHVAESTHKRGHILDLIITKSTDLLVNNSSPSFDLPSDHALVICRLSIPRPKPTRVLVNHRNLRRINVDHFKDSLVSSSLMSSPSPKLSSLTLQYDTVLRDLLDLHAPQRTRYVTLRPHAPWFDDSLREAKLNKRRLERKWRSTGLEVDRSSYRDHCATYHRLLADTKTAYHNNKLKNLNQKALFKEVDKLVNGKKPQILPINIDKDDLPASFGNFFKNKVDNLRYSTSAADCQPLCLPLEPECPEQLTEFTLLDPDEICSIVMKSPTKSCSLDPIPTVLFKECIGVLLPTIVGIVNSSLAFGFVPDVFKSAQVTPRIKKPTLDQNILCNYRPISNLCFLSKLLERAVLPQLISYLHSNNLYPELQSAYRSGHSTETALLRVHNDLLRAVDDGNEALVILLDFSSAFDTIDHGLLLRRLEKRFGLSGTVISWFNSYLNNRTQCISIGHSSSSPYVLESGVPQGSVLGPILFCLYVAPLEDIFLSHGISAMMYADDTQLYVIIKKQQHDMAVLKLENCVKDIKAWCVSNKLVLSDGKTEVLHIHSKFSRSVSVLPDITIGDSVIKPKYEARNLGVLFDSNLSSKQQINNCCKTSFMALSNIGKIRKYLDQPQAEKLVHAFVTTRLDQCNSLLFGLPESEIKKLQRVLNVAARIVSRSKKENHMSDILKNLHWLPVRARIQYKILLLVYKARNGLAPKYLADLITDYTTSRTLRSTGKGLLAAPHIITKNYGDRAFSAAGPKLWNSLPSDITMAKSLTIFKSKLKTFLFKKSFND